MSQQMASPAGSDKTSPDKAGWMTSFLSAMTDFVTPRVIACACGIARVACQQFKLVRMQADKEARAAMFIQCAVRIFLARKRAHYLRTMRRLVMLMAGRERSARLKACTLVTAVLFIGIHASRRRKYAMMIQQHWRERVEACCCARLHQGRPRDVICVALPQEKKQNDVAKIQAVAKGGLERRRLRQQRSVQTFSENRAARVRRRRCVTG